MLILTDAVRAVARRAHLTGFGEPQFKITRLRHK
jgi:hypothetical protein